MLIIQKLICISVLIVTITIPINAKSLPHKAQRSQTESQIEQQNEPELYTLPKPFKHLQPTVMPNNVNSAYLNDIEYDLRLRQLMEELVLKSRVENPQQAVHVLLPNNLKDEYEKLLQTTAPTATIMQQEKSEVYQQQQHKLAPSISQISIENMKITQQDSTDNNKFMKESSNSKEPQQQNSSLKDSLLDYVLIEYMTNTKQNIANILETIKTNGTLSSATNANKIRQQLEFLQKNAEKFKKFQQVQERTKNSTQTEWDVLSEIERIQQSSLNSIVNEMNMKQSATNTKEAIDKNDNEDVQSSDSKVIEINMNQSSMNPKEAIDKNVNKDVPNSESIANETNMNQSAMKSKEATDKNGEVNVQNLDSIVQEINMNQSAMKSKEHTDKNINDSDAIINEMSINNNSKNSKETSDEKDNGDVQSLELTVNEMNMSHSSINSKDVNDKNDNTDVQSSDSIVNENNMSPSTTNYKEATDKNYKENVQSSISISNEINMNDSFINSKEAIANNFSGDVQSSDTIVNEINLNHSSMNSTEATDKNDNGDVQSSVSVVNEMSINHSSMKSKEAADKNVGGNVQFSASIVNEMNTNYSSINSKEANDKNVIGNVQSSDSIGNEMSINNSSQNSKDTSDENDNEDVQTSDLTVNEMHMSYSSINSKEATDTNNNGDVQSSNMNINQSAINSKEPTDKNVQNWDSITNEINMNHSSMNSKEANEKNDNGDVENLDLTVNEMNMNYKGNVQSSISISNEINMNDSFLNSKEAIDNNYSVDSQSSDTIVNEINLNHSSMNSKEHTDKKDNGDVQNLDSIANEMNISHSSINFKEAADRNINGNVQSSIIISNEINMNNSSMNSTEATDKNDNGDVQSSDSVVNEMSINHSSMKSKEVADKNVNGNVQFSDSIANEMKTNHSSINSKEANDKNVNGNVQSSISIINGINISHSSINSKEATDTNINGNLQSSISTGNEMNMNHSSMNSKEATDKDDNGEVQNLASAVNEMNQISMSSKETTDVNDKEDVQSSEFAVNEMNRNEIAMNSKGSTDMTGKADVQSSISLTKNEMSLGLENTQFDLLNSPVFNKTESIQMINDIEVPIDIIIENAILINHKTKEIFEFPKLEDSSNSNPEDQTPSTENQIKMQRSPNENKTVIELESLNQLENSTVLSILKTQEQKDHKVDEIIHQWNAQETNYTDFNKSAINKENLKESYNKELQEIDKVNNPNYLNIEPSISKENFNAILYRNQNIETEISTNHTELPMYTNSALENSSPMEMIKVIQNFDITTKDFENIETTTEIGELNSSFTEIYETSREPSVNISNSVSKNQVTIMDKVDKVREEINSESLESLSLPNIMLPLAIILKQNISRNESPSQYTFTEDNKEIFQAENTFSGGQTSNMINNQSETINQQNSTKHSHSDNFVGSHETNTLKDINSTEAIIPILTIYNSSTTKYQTEVLKKVDNLRTYVLAAIKESNIEDKINTSLNKIASNQTTFTEDSDKQKLLLAKTNVAKEESKSKYRFDNEGEINTEANLDTTMLPEIVKNDAATSTNYNYVYDKNTTIATFEPTTQGLKNASQQNERLELTKKYQNPSDYKEGIFENDETNNTEITTEGSPLYTDFETREASNQMLKLATDNLKGYLDEFKEKPSTAEFDEATAGAASMITEANLLSKNNLTNSTESYNVIANLMQQIITQFTDITMDTAADIEDATADVKNDKEFIISNSIYPNFITTEVNLLAEDNSTDTKESYNVMTTLMPQITIELPDIATATVANIENTTTNFNNDKEFAIPNSQIITEYRNSYNSMEQLNSEELENFEEDMLTSSNVSILGFHEESTTEILQYMDEQNGTIQLRNQNSVMTKEDTITEMLTEQKQNKSKINFNRNSNELHNLQKTIILNSNDETKTTSKNVSTEIPRNNITTELPILQTTSTIESLHIETTEQPINFHSYYNTQQVDTRTELPIFENTELPQTTKISNPIATELPISDTTEQKINTHSYYVSQQIDIKTDLPIFESTEMPNTTEILNSIVTELPTLHTTDFPATTEKHIPSVLPISESTELPTTIKVLNSITTEMPISQTTDIPATTELPIFKSTELPTTTEFLSTIVTELPISHTTDVPAITELPIFKSTEFPTTIEFLSTIEAELPISYTATREIDTKTELPIFENTELPTATEILNTITTEMPTSHTTDFTGTTEIDTKTVFPIFESTELPTTTEDLLSQANELPISYTTDLPTTTKYTTNNENAIEQRLADATTELPIFQTTELPTTIYGLSLKRIHQHIADNLPSNNEKQETTEISADLPIIKKAEMETVIDVLASQAIELLSGNLESGNTEYKEHLNTTKFEGDSISDGSPIDAEENTNDKGAVIYTTNRSTTSSTSTTELAKNESSQLESIKLGTQLPIDQISTLREVLTYKTTEIPSEVYFEVGEHPILHQSTGGAASDKSPEQFTESPSFSEYFTSENSTKFSKLYVTDVLNKNYTSESFTQELPAPSTTFSPTDMEGLKSQKGELFKLKIYDDEEEYASTTESNEDIFLITTEFPNVLHMDLPTTAEDYKFQNLELSIESEEKFIFDANEKRLKIYDKEEEENLSTTEYNEDANLVTTELPNVQTMDLTTKIKSEEKLKIWNNTDMQFSTTESSRDAILDGYQDSDDFNQEGIYNYNIENHNSTFTENIPNSNISKLDLKNTQITELPIAQTTDLPATTENINIRITELLSNDQENTSESTAILDDSQANTKLNLEIIKNDKRVIFMSANLAALNQSSSNPTDITNSVLTEKLHNNTSALDIENIQLITELTKMPTKASPNAKENLEMDGELQIWNNEEKYSVLSDDSQERFDNNYSSDMEVESKVFETNLQSLSDDEQNDIVAENILNQDTTEIPNILNPTFKSELDFEENNTMETQHLLVLLNNRTEYETPDEETKNNNLNNIPNINDIYSKSSVTENTNQSLNTESPPILETIISGNTDMNLMPKLTEEIKPLTGENLTNYPDDENSMLPVLLSVENSPLPMDLTTNEQVESVTEIVWLTQSTSYQKPSVIIENIPYKTTISGTLSLLANDMSNAAKADILKPHEKSETLEELITIIGNSLQEENVLENEQQKHKEQPLHKIQEDVTSTVNCHTQTMQLSISSSKAAIEMKGAAGTSKTTEGNMNAVVEKTIENQKQNIEKWSTFKNNQLNNDSLTKADNDDKKENANADVDVNDSDAAADVAGDYDDDDDDDNDNNDNEDFDEGTLTSATFANDKDMRLEMKVKKDMVNEKYYNNNDNARVVENRNNDEIEAAAAATSTAVTATGQQYWANNEFKESQIEGGMNEMSTIENKLVDISKLKSNDMTSSTTATTTLSSIAPDDKHEMVNENSKKDYTNKGNETENVKTNNNNSNSTYKIQQNQKDDETDYGTDGNEEEIVKEDDDDEGDDDEDDDDDENDDGVDDEIQEISKISNVIFNSESFPDITPYHSNSNSNKKHILSSAQTREEITTTNWWQSLPYAEIRKFLNSIFDSVTSTTDDFSLNRSVDTMVAAAAGPAPPSTTSTTNDNKVILMKKRKSKEQWSSLMLNNIWSLLL